MSYNSCSALRITRIDVLFSWNCLIDKLDWKHNVKPEEVDEILLSGDNMSEAKQIPEMNGYEEIAEFWDTHSLADFWDQTEPAEFEISPDARRRYMVAIDPDVLNRVKQIAHIRGLSTQSLRSTCG